jgi:hypothetical protein
VFDDDGELVTDPIEDIILAGNRRNKMRRSRGSARRTRGPGRTRRPGNRVVQRRRPNRSSKRRSSTKSPRRPITRNMSRHSGRKSIQRRVGGRSVARRTAARSARRMGSARRRTGSARRMGNQGSMGVNSSGIPGGHSYRGRQGIGRATDMTSAKVRFGPGGLAGAGLPSNWKYQRDRNEFNANWRVITGKHGQTIMVNNKNVRNSRVKGGATNMQVKQADGTYKSVTQN